MSKIFDLNAGLKEIRTSKFTKASSIAVGKLVVELEITDDLLVNLDPGDLSTSLADKLVKQFQANIYAGRKLDGTQAKALAPSTIKRRLYRREQAKRGGQLADRYKKKKYRSAGVRNWNKRYKTTQQGTGNPAQSPSPIDHPAVESGVLVRSAAVVPSSDGKSAQIFFANIRGLTDRSGNSPAGRAFQMPTSRVLDKVLQSPQGQQALHELVDDEVNVGPGNRTGRGPKLPSLYRTLRTTAQNTQALTEELEPIE